MTVQFRKSLWRYALLKLLGRFSSNFFTGPLGLITLMDIKPPSLPSPRWVRVRPILSGICGSDLSVIKAESSLLLSPLTSTPFTFGHEIVGEVIEVGSGIKTFKAGDRVIVEPTLNCFVREIDPPCQCCNDGNYSCCERVVEGLISAGVQTGYCSDTSGGWSEQFIAHERQLFSVPDTFKDKVAVLVEPFSCSLHAVLKGMSLLQNQQSKSKPLALVLGCGSIGLLTITAIRSVEKKLMDRPPMYILASAKYSHQKEWALRLGADEIVPVGLQGYEILKERTGAKLFQPEIGKPTVLGGVDIVFDCIGSRSSLEDAVRWAKANGAVVVVGMPAEPKVSWTSLWFKELKVVGAYAYGTEDWQGEKIRTFKLALQLMEEEVTKLNGFVTHIFPLNRWKEAIQIALHTGKHSAIKVALQPTNNLI